MIGLLLSLGLLFAQETPPTLSEHSLIYYNARLAMREGRALDATRLWLLRNALKEQTQTVSDSDADFRSVTWAALGEQGLCADGFRDDMDGVGLWPLSLHNWVVVNRRRRGAPRRLRPFKAFEVDHQQRFVSLRDVLSFEELRTFRPQRGRCLRPRLALLDQGEFVTADLSDRWIATRLLQFYLRESRETLKTERVRGLSVIDARLFDIQLQLIELKAREAKKDERALTRLERLIGLSSKARELRRDADGSVAIWAQPELRRVLLASLEWSPSDWMVLSSDRRLFLFDQIAEVAPDTERVSVIALFILDELIQRGEGQEVERWIARWTARVDSRDAVWSGDRGRRLMSLDDDSGFRERSIVSLHRGVDHLERGDLPGSIRAFAYALQHAPESREASRVQSLSLRWLSYVAAQFEITDELLITLKQLVPRRDYSVILEDLMWTAAFHADRRSFERGVAHQAGRGALTRRVEWLTPLAQGKSGHFARRLRDVLGESPSEALRFLDQLVQRLELENAEVRRNQLSTLRLIRRLIAPLADANSKGRQGRTAAALMQRTQAIVEGLGASLKSSAHDRARSLDPSGTVFAGSVRLAPVDPLPWPFQVAEVRAPSIFEPIVIRPVEWRDEAGDWVFGWGISE